MRISGIRQRIFPFLVSFLRKPAEFQSVFQFLSVSLPNFQYLIYTFQSVTRINGGGKRLLVTLTKVCGINRYHILDEFDICLSLHQNSKS